MLSIYKAKIVGDSIIWLGKQPKQPMDNNTEVIVITEDVEDKNLTKGMKNKEDVLSELTQLANRINDSKILNPLEWQREIRKDRDLGRQ
jgi:hypothetical protein